MMCLMMCNDIQQISNNNIVNLVHPFERYIIPLVIFRLSLDTQREKRERNSKRKRLIIINFLQTYDGV